MADLSRVLLARALPATAAAAVANNDPNPKISAPISPPHPHYCGQPWQGDAVALSLLKKQQHIYLFSVLLGHS